MTNEIGVDDINPFDLTAWIEEGSLLLGFMGVVKYLDPDGNLSVVGVSHGVAPWEVPGLLPLVEAASGNFIPVYDSEEDCDG